MHRSLKQEKLAKAREKLSRVNNDIAEMSARGAHSQELVKINRDFCQAVMELQEAEKMRDEMQCKDCGAAIDGDRDRFARLLVMSVDESWDKTGPTPYTGAVLEYIKCYTCYCKLKLHEQALKP